MSLLSRSLQTKLAPTPGDYRTLPAPNFQLLNGRLVAYADNKETFITKAYNINDIVFSIVNLIADKIRVAPWNVYTVKDERSLKLLQGMMRKKNWSARDYGVAKALQHKALEISNNPGKLGELLKFPNETQSFSDMVADASIFKMLTGDLYVWANMLTGGANAGLPNNLELLPSQFVSIYCTDTFPSTVTGYEVNLWKGKRYMPKEVMHVKYFNPDYTVNGAQHYGVSPLKAALSLIQRNNSSMKASASTFNNEGIRGLVTLDNKPGEVDGDLALAEVDRLAEAMRTSWSGPENRGKIGIGGYRMQWLPMGLTSEQMQVIESEKWDMRRLCNLFGIQSQLLNDPDNKTYANQEEAEKSLTTRAALPQLTVFRDTLNRKLQQNWGGKPNQVIDFDMTVFTELQQDMQKLVTALTPLMDRGLPINRVLDIMNLELIDDDYYDKPRVTPQMGQTREEYDLNEVDRALNQATDDDEEDIS